MAAARLRRNTHSPSAAVRRVSRIAAVRSVRVSGIDHRAFAVLSKGDVESAAPDMLPPQPEALFGPEAAIDQDRRDVPQQERIARLERLLATLCARIPSRAPWYASKMLWPTPDAASRYLASSSAVRTRSRWFYS